MREKVRIIGELLEEEYGQPAPREELPPLDELVLTILSQHTSDSNSGRAFQSLRQRFGTWEEVRDASPEDIEEAIRAGGLARTKATRIKALLERLSEERPTLDLDFLSMLTLDEARKFLLDLDGVGPKTAACVLLFSCGLPAFPVDTHVHRVSSRLGLIARGTTAEEAHRLLEDAVPSQEVYSFHVNLITHGRRVCKAPRPHCERCVLAPECDYFNRGGNRTTESDSADTQAEDRPT